ncbi:MAG: hypothetical protein LW606_07175 [Ilumatobacteraceae bacterium]|jgi:hypothetical protein|nr:hypothetical protein [Ilumatobacteraceae bacterium]
MMLNVLTSVAFVALLGGLTWLVRARDPHWSSKDGTKFICRIQVLNEHGGTPSRWREVRCTITGNDSVAIVPRGFGHRHLAKEWRVVETMSVGPRRSRMFLLRNDQLIALRVPTSSPAATRLDTLLARAREGGAA